MREQHDHGAWPLTINTSPPLGDTRRFTRGTVEAVAAQQRKERVGQRRRIHTRLQSLEGEVVAGERLQNRFVFQTGRKFNFAKLHRLKTTGGIQLVSKSKKADRLHGFENVNLGDEQLFNFHSAS